MKQAFATSWKSSTQPRKQRKYVYNAPLHLRTAFLASTLSKDLRKKHNTRSVAVRTGDKVKVLRGQYKGTIGKVTSVDRASARAMVEGAEFIKSDGSKQLYPIHPSNLIIIEMSSDKKRLPAAPKKKTAAKKEE